ncbi:hypothetical protein LJC09_01340 [Desulfovibrio sp. OttesenSCG-928-F20]|nr:hypothetical protein [Desulfovibrio sp. OttesenSCG-928-F20]
MNTKEKQIKEKMISLPGVNQDCGPNEQQNLLGKKKAISFEKMLARNILEKESTLIKSYLKKYEVFEK